MSLSTLRISLYNRLLVLLDSDLVNRKSTEFEIDGKRFCLDRFKHSSKNRDGKYVRTDDYNHLVEQEVWQVLRRGLHFIWRLETDADGHEIRTLCHSSHGVYKFMDRDLPLDLETPFTPIRTKDGDPKPTHPLALEHEIDGLVVYLTKKENGEFCMISVFEVESQVYLSVSSKNRPIVCRLSLDTWRQDLETFPGYDQDMHAERMTETFMGYFGQMDEGQRSNLIAHLLGGKALCCEHLDQMHQHIVKPDAGGEEGNLLRVFALTSPSTENGIMACSIEEAATLVESWGLRFVEYHRFDLSDDLQAYMEMAEEKRRQPESEGTVFTVCALTDGGKEFPMYSGKDKNYWYIVARSFRQKILALTPLSKLKLGDYQQEALDKLQNFDQEWFHAFFGYLLKHYGELSQEMVPLSANESYQAAIAQFHDSYQIDSGAWNELIYAFYVTLMDRFREVPTEDHSAYIDFAFRWGEIKLQQQSFWPLYTNQIRVYAMGLDQSLEGFDSVQVPYEVKEVNRMQSGEILIVSTLVPDGTSPGILKGIQKVATRKGITVLWLHNGEIDPPSQAKEIYDSIGEIQTRLQDLTIQNDMVAAVAGPSTSTSTSAEVLDQVQVQVLAFLFGGPGSGKSYLTEQLVMAFQDEYVVLVLSSDEFGQQRKKLYNQILAALAQMKTLSPDDLDSQFPKKCRPLSKKCPELLNALEQAHRENKPLLVIRDKCTPDPKHLPKGTDVCLTFPTGAEFALLCLSQAMDRHNHVGGVDLGQMDLEELIRVVLSYCREAAKHQQNVGQPFPMHQQNVGQPFPMHQKATINWHQIHLTPTGVSDVPDPILQAVQNLLAPSGGVPVGDSFGSEEVADCAASIKEWFEAGNRVTGTTNLDLDQVRAALQAEPLEVKPEVVYWSLQVSPDDLASIFGIRDEALAVTDTKVTIKKEFHLTLVFRPTDDESGQLWPGIDSNGNGRQFPIQILGLAAASGENGAVCLVCKFSDNQDEVPPICRLDKNCEPHITLAFQKKAQHAGLVAGRAIREENFGQTDGTFWVPLDMVVQGTLTPFLKN